MLSLLVQKAGCFGALLIVVKCYAIVAAVPDSHPVHIEPPATGVELVDLRTAHFQLQMWGQDMVHCLLQCVIAPMSEKTANQTALTIIGSLPFEKIYI